MPDHTARLIVHDAEGNSREVPLSTTPFMLGREARCDLVLPDHRISRRHARIIRNEWGFSLEDTASLHGTYVNGERIERCPLKDGDRITLGISDAYQLTFLSGEGVLDKLLEKIERAPESLAPRLEHLNTLLQLSHMLHRAAALEEILAAVVDSALQMSGAERGMLFLLDEEGRPVMRAARGPARPDPERGGEGYSKELVMRVIESRRQEVMLEDTAQSGTAYDTVVVPSGQRGALAIPLQILPVAEVSGAETIRQAVPELLGVLYVESRFRPAAITSLDRDALDTLALQGAMIIENARLLRLAREQERSRHEMELARSIQQSLLPRKLPQAGYFQFYALTTACRTVGGDYYDFASLAGDRFGLTVADVSGKGLPAAMMAMTLQGAFSAMASADMDLSELFRRINLFLCERTPPEMYATLFYGVLGPSGTFEFINAGHVPPLHIAATGEVRMLSSPAFPLGMFPHATHDASALKLSPGDQILLFSDGLTEARNEAEEFLGEERLERMVRDCALADALPQEVCSKLVAAVEDFAGSAPQADDLTVAILRYAPSTAVNELSG